MLQRINDHIMRAKTLPVNFKLFIKAVELRIAFIDVRLDERSLRIAFPFAPAGTPAQDALPFLSAQKRECPPLPARRLNGADSPPVDTALPYARRRLYPPYAHSA